MSQIINGQKVSGSNAVGHASFKPVATALTYATGKTIGGLLTIAKFGKDKDTDPLLRTAHLHSAAALTVEIDLYLFREAPSASTFVDNGTFAVAAADQAKLVKVLKFTTYDNAGGTGVLGDLTGINEQIPLADGSTIYGVVVARGAVTFATPNDLSIVLSAEMI